MEVSFKGGEDRASVVIVKGPIGGSNGGLNVGLTVVPKYNWVGVTQNPVDGLKPVDLETIARERSFFAKS